jgi:outer membrane protein OmpA-like peptidoglycan-associated protein
MFIRKAPLIAGLAILSFCAHAQEYVQNGSFEELRTDIKGKGSIKASKFWISTTKVQADLFSNDAKSEIEPLYEGLKTKEISSKGEHFSGLVAYSFLAQEPRSYLSVLLKKPLKTGDFYCASMDVMLHERAKYHTTNLSVLATSADIGFDEEVNLLDDFSKQVSYENEPIPGMWIKAYVGFEASEDAQILNVGNFTSDSKSTYKRIDKTAKQVLTGQFPLAYYFIDNVSLVSVGSLEQCGVQPMMAEKAKAKTSESEYDKGQKPKVEKETGFSRAAFPKVKRPVVVDNTPVEIVGDEALDQAMRDENTIVFLDYSAGLDKNLYDKIDKLLINFQKGKNNTITLIGRTSFDEDQASKQNRMMRSLSDKRLHSVAEYLSRKGVSKERIVTVNEPFNAAKLQGGSPTVSFIFNP